MTYANRLDLEQRYGTDEIEQRESVLPVGAIEQRLLAADAFIDGYLAGRYSLPLSVVPDNLTQIACAVARYQLLGDSITERARADYDDAVAWLKDVANGRVKLPSDVVQVTANGSQEVVMLVGSDAVFKRGGRP